MRTGSPVQAASVAAWNDEAHVLENRNQYRESSPFVTRWWRGAAPPCRTRALPLGPHAGPTPISPAACSPPIMSSFYPAASWPGKPEASIPAPDSSASPWSPPDECPKPPAVFASSHNNLKNNHEPSLQATIEPSGNAAPNFPLRPAQVATISRSSTSSIPAPAGGRKVGGEWITHQWIKKAVLLSFRVRDNRVQEGGDIRYFDKVDTKFEGWSEERFREGGFRVVPGTIVRKGSFVARNAVLMPSFVNIGGYVDEATMVDTWVTVGSCAQIGKNVHLSGGVGIGGVLEPLQANPTIIGTTASSAPAPRWSKASSSAKTR